MEAVLSPSRSRQVNKVHQMERTGGSSQPTELDKNIYTKNKRLTTCFCLGVLQELEGKGPVDLQPSQATSETSTNGEPEFNP